MGFWNKLGEQYRDLMGTGEQRRLVEENEALYERERKAISYIREKTNQLLTTIGTLPLRHEELDDELLLDTDPIGIVCESFEQILNHLNEVNHDLRLAHEEIQGIFDCADAIILVLDREMKIQACNSRAREYFALNGEPKTCAEAICKVQPPPEGCIFRRMMASKRPESHREWECANRFFNVSGTPIKDRFGDVEQVVLVYADISDEKRLLEALREKEGLYQLILDSASDLFQSIAPDGRFYFVNRAWKDALGYSDSDLESLTVFDIIHPDSHAHCRELFVKLLHGGRTGPVSFSFIAKDGRQVPVSGSVSCSFRGGKPYATCGILHIVPVRQAGDNEHGPGNVIPIQRHTP
ncbi:histidine kinase [Geotalea uraniireducens]|uniref:Histidine kinase n=1 Tax=Geotalea uraniireducens TaxID=351604 RepID=A0ABM8EMU9_9BACT|nr:PAS domain S-box protein [Geotalea uraniireducens]BDV43920.1 histidine kinase [Geotalea uraniireducens]